MHFTVWDLFLLVSVTSMAVLLAYIRHPRWKALVLCFPVPFTLTFLSLGRPIDATNVTGLLVLLFYTHAVRILRYSLRLPILLSILIAASLYCILGGFLASVLPKTDAAFWIILSVVLFVAVIVRIVQPDIAEPGHRSPIPLVYKIPLTLLLVGILL